jgi:hypothetical protein
MKGIKRILVVVGAATLLVQALPAGAARKQQTQEVKCETSTGASAETKNYYVNICGHGTEEDPITFVLTAKAGRTIKMPTRKNDLFVANRGAYEYTLVIKNPPEPNACECGGEAVRLTIKKAGKIVVSERVINDRSGYLFLP